VVGATVVDVVRGVTCEVLVHTKRLPTLLHVSVADFETVVAPAVRHAVPDLVGTAVSGGEMLIGSTLVNNEAPMVAV
jgi:hypothetical protein